VAAHLGRLYNFAFRMAMDERRAGRVVEDTFARAWVDLDSVPPDDREAELHLLKLAMAVAAERLSRSPEVNFDILDETLRNEATRTDVVRSLSDPQRDLLLWDLKQGCMTSVINCLGPGERAAFIAAQILKLGDDDAAAALGVTVSAYRVRLSRARQKIGDYLAPRCEHVDPMNPCRCPARVGDRAAQGLHPAADATGRRRGVVAPAAVALWPLRRGPRRRRRAPSATSRRSTADCLRRSRRPSCARGWTRRSTRRSAERSAERSAARSAVRGRSRARRVVSR
jgi:DNA-directed RNA polymerase specialized sigma24 family protein